MSEPKNANDSTTDDVSAGVLDDESPGAHAQPEPTRSELEAELEILRARAQEAGEGDPDDLAIQREVRKGSQKGELCGHPVMVPPLKSWKSSAMKALNAGDFETWAERTLDDDGWEVWQDVDPSLDEIDAFFGTFDLGVGRGNSRGSRRSSRPTPNR